MVDRGSFKTIQEFSFINERIRSCAPVASMTPLPDGWQPNAWSVICGRGKESYMHIGNRRFRILADLNLEKYKSATSKIAKSMIVMGIVDAVREGSRVGGFVKKNLRTGNWSEVGDAVAREKVGQQLRENLARVTPEKCQARRIQRQKKCKRPSMAVSVSSCEESSSLCQSINSTVTKDFPPTIESSNIKPVEASSTKLVEDWKSSPVTATNNSPFFEFDLQPLPFVRTPRQPQPVHNLYQPPYRY